ncbi:hypothetical protein C0993_004492 [Termitomyces sp. T159_Od127]|nr:hypothetical protein C0993_004492 [Termitomyces sp. T159_Od127]
MVDIKLKPSGSANAVKALSSNDEFAFAVEEGTDLDFLPDLQSEFKSDVSNTDESCRSRADAAMMDDDWFSEVDKNEVTDAEVDNDWSCVTAGLRSLSLNGMPVRLSCHILDLIGGEGKTSHHASDPIVAKGVPLLKPTVEEELASQLIEDGQTDWMMLAEDGLFYEEYALAAEIVDVE